MEQEGMYIYRDVLPVRTSNLIFPTVSGNQDTAIVGDILLQMVAMWRERDSSSTMCVFIHVFLCMYSTRVYRYKLVKQ